MGNFLHGLISTDFQEEAIYNVCCNQSDKRTCQKVTRIMYSQVNARIASQQCPSHYKYSEPSLTEKEPDKECQPESIGSMTRGKTITPTSITIYDVYHIGYRIFQISRAKTLHIRAYQCCTCLVGNGNDEC